MSEDKKLYFLFSEPLGSDKDWINALNIQREQRAIVNAVRNSGVEFKIAQGSSIEISSAINDNAQLLHISGHISKKNELILEHVLDPDHFSKDDLTQLLKAHITGNRANRTSPHSACGWDDTRTQTRGRSLSETLLTRSDQAEDYSNDVDNMSTTDSFASSITFNQPQENNKRSTAPATELPFKIVVLNACFSQSFASCFLDLGVKHVICYPHDKEVPDDVAVRFSDVFYKKLFSGSTVYDAFIYAQQQVDNLARGTKRIVEPYKLLPRTSSDPVYSEADRIHHSVSYFWRDSRKESIFIPPYASPIQNIRDQPAAIGCSGIIQSIMKEFVKERKRFIVLYGDPGVGKTCVTQLVAFMLHWRCMVRDVYTVDVREVITKIADEVSKYVLDKRSLPPLDRVKSFALDALLSELSRALHMFSVKFEKMQDVVDMFDAPKRAISRLQNGNVTVDRGLKRLDFENSHFCHSIGEKTEPTLPLLILEHASDLQHLHDLKIPYVPQMCKPFEELLKTLHGSRTPYANVLSAGKWPGHENHKPHPIRMEPISQDVALTMLVKTLDHSVVENLLVKIPQSNPRFPQPDVKLSAEEKLKCLLRIHPHAPQFTASPLLVERMKLTLTEYQNVDKAWDAVEKSLPPGVKMITANSSVQDMMCCIESAGGFKYEETAVARTSIVSGILKSNTQPTRFHPNYNVMQPANDMMSLSSPHPPLPLHFSSQHFPYPHAFPYQHQHPHHPPAQITHAAPSQTPYAVPGHVPHAAAITTAASMAGTAAIASTASNVAAAAAVPAPTPPVTTAPSTNYQTHAVLPHPQPIVGSASRIPQPALSDNTSQTPSPNPSYEPTVTPNRSLPMMFASMSLDSIEIPTDTADNQPTPAALWPTDATSSSISTSLSPISPDAPPTPTAPSRHATATAHGSPLAPPDSIPQPSLNNMVSLDTATLRPVRSSISAGHTTPIKQFYAELHVEFSHSKISSAQPKDTLTSMADLEKFRTILYKRLNSIQQAVSRVDTLQLKDVSHVALWKMFEIVNPVQEPSVRLMQAFVHGMFLAITRSFDPLIETPARIVDGWGATNLKPNKYAHFSLHDTLMLIFEWKDFALLENVPEPSADGSVDATPGGWKQGWERLNALADLLPLIRQEWEAGKIWMCSRDQLRDELFAFHKNANVPVEELKAYAIRIDPNDMKVSVGYCIESVDAANNKALRFVDVELNPLEKEPGFLTYSRMRQVHNLRLQTVQELLDRLGLRNAVGDVHTVKPLSLAHPYEVNEH